LDLSTPEHRWLTFKVETGEDSGLGRTGEEHPSAVKHNVTVDARHLCLDRKRSILVWMFKLVSRTRKVESTADVRCLWIVHSILTQGDMIDMLDVATDGCKRHRQCLAVGIGG
jgi:hypothetical protein